jgi:hypothetical protein
LSFDERLIFPSPGSGSAIFLLVASEQACSLIGSRLDYCNALLYGASTSNNAKLQRVQNSLARVVCSVSDRSIGADTLLHQLHWLPVERRVELKLASLCYKTFHADQPSYMASISCNFMQGRLHHIGLGNFSSTKKFGVDEIGVGVVEKNVSLVLYAIHCSAVTFQLVCQSSQ